MVQVAITTVAEVVIMKAMHFAHLILDIPRFAVKQYERERRPKVT